MVIKMSNIYTPTIKKARKEFCISILNDIIEPMRHIARINGYALAVHGSLSRDIDLIAIPWVEHAETAGFLANELCDCLKAFFGSCCLQGEVGIKPHGRKAYSIILSNTNVWIDLSIMPCIEDINDE